MPIEAHVAAATKVPAENPLDDSKRADVKKVSTVAVTASRKQELLLEARRNRVEWVDASSSPVLSVHNDQFASSSTDDENIMEGIVAAKDGFELIEKSHAVNKYLKSTLNILMVLYGLNGEDITGSFDSKKDGENSDAENKISTAARMDVSERISKLINSQLSLEDYKKATIDHSSTSLLTSDQSSQETTTKNTRSSKDDVQKTMWKSYNFFIQTLRGPESADIVQGMKHFVESIEDRVRLISTTNNTSVTQEEDKKVMEQKLSDLTQISSAIQTYIENVVTSMQTSYHPVWSNSKKKQALDSGKQDSNNDTILTDNMPLEQQQQQNSQDWDQSFRRPLETFLYSKVHNMIWKILKDTLAPSSTDDDDDIDTFDDPEATHDTQRKQKRITNCEKDLFLMNRMKELQFVTAKHLDLHNVLQPQPQSSNNDNQDNTKSEDNEISCSIQKENNNDNENHNNHLREILSKPIQILKKLPIYYSPYDKISCIHEAYQQINIILSELSTKSKDEEQGESSDSNSTATKGDNKKQSYLPSADDVLPTFIYTLIQAQPMDVWTHLYLIELFATPDLLRGEGGYAYTSLYCAVQFLLDLDMSEFKGSSPSNNNKSMESSKENNTDNTATTSTSLLNIGKGENWEENLSKCQNKVLNEKTSHDDIEENKSTLTVSATEHDTKGVEEEFPSISEIRAARLKGQTIDSEWIRNWQRGRHSSGMSSTHLSHHNTDEDTLVGHDNGIDKSNISNHNNRKTKGIFPGGFSRRQYSFLGKDAQDIRAVDISRLLEEYHQLIHVCEVMVSERSAMHFDQMKKSKELIRSKLESDHAMAANRVEQLQQKQEDEKEEDVVDKTDD